MTICEEKILSMKIEMIKISKMKMGAQKVNITSKHSNS